MPGQKFDFTPPSLLKYHKDFANSLYWVISGCVPLSTKINKINLSEHLMFICMQKTNFIPPFFFEILQKYYKWAILGTLGIPFYDQ